MMQKAPPEMGSSSDKQPDTHLLTISSPVQTPQAFVASTGFEQGWAKSAPPMKSRRTRRGVPKSYLFAGRLQPRRNQRLLTEVQLVWR